MPTLVLSGSGGSLSDTPLKPSESNRWHATSMSLVSHRVGKRPSHSNAADSDRPGWGRNVCARGLTAVASALLIAGCAGYDASPLDGSSADAALAAPDRAKLAVQASGLCNPRIAPTTLDFSKPLTADELSVIAVLVSPDLKAMRAREGVAAAQVFDAGLLSDPVLAAGLDHPTSNQPGLVNAYNLGLTWDILGIITRGAARRAAQAGRMKVRNDVAWQEWTVANQARQQAYRVAFLGSRQALADAASATAARLLEVSRREFERRDITIDALALREVADLDARDQALALARTLASERLALNKTLGLPPAETVPLAEPASLDKPVLDASALFNVARSERLDLLALRAGYQAQEYQLQRDLLARYPRFNLGPQLARDTGDVTTFGISASITLPIFSGGRGAVAIARATREQLRAEYEARLFQTRSDIATLVADIRRVEQEIDPLKTQLPALQRAESVMRGAAASGDVLLITYETVRSNLLTKQLQLLSLEQARAEQQIALQLAVGAPLNTKEPRCERQAS